MFLLSYSSYLSYLLTYICLFVWVTAYWNKKSRYRKDDPAMRPIYERPENCKRKINRRLRKNRHITILSLLGGEIIFEVFQPMWSRNLIVT